MTTLFVVVLTYIRPLEEVDAAGPAHVAWLRRGYDRGVFLVSGRRVPRTGGVIIAKAASLPEVEALKALNAQRLAALNHGSVRSPIPGRETQMVLTKLRNWASEVGEIKITEDMNPVISIQITGVDTDPILASVAEVRARGWNRG